MTQNRVPPLILSIAFLSFVLLGVSTSLLGVAWPSIRTDFQLRLEDMGILLVATTVGYTITSLASGQIVGRLGVGRSILAAVLAATIGLFALALSPVWTTMVIFSFLVGSGNGILDSVINIFLAPRVRAGLISWLHASFGVGSTAGPILVTSILQASLPWRAAYGIAAGGEAVVFVLVLLTIRRWDDQRPIKPEIADSTPAKATSPWLTLSMGSVWLYILIFFLQGGYETTAGQWSYSVFTQGRGVQPALAGAWVSIYWGTFTIGRFLLGLVHIDPVKIVRIGTVFMIIGAALFWWNPINLVGFLGLAIMGIAVAPLFPNLVSNTPRLVGNAHAANSIGFQVASSSISIGLLPPLAGLLAARISLETLGPFLLIQAVMILLLHERTVVLQAKVQNEIKPIPGERTIHLEE